MKRSIVIGVACFLLGSMSSPKAAGDRNETLDILCARYRATNGDKLLETARKLSAAESDKIGQAFVTLSLAAQLKAIACGETGLKTLSRGP